MSVEVRTHTPTREFPSTIIIDSYKRTSGTPGSFSVTMPQLNNVHIYRLKRIMIPGTWYNITSTNNVTTVDIGAGDVTATVAVGRYTVSAYVAALLAALVLLDATFTVTFDTITNKITIARIGNFTLRTSLNAFNSRVLGYTTTDKTGAATYTALNVLNLMPLQYFTLHSKMLTRNIDYNNHVDGRPYLVSAIPLLGGSSDLSYMELENPRWLELNIQGTVLCPQNVDFYIMDLDLNVMNFNGVDLWFELEFM